MWENGKQKQMQAGEGTGRVWQVNRTSSSREDWDAGQQMKKNALPSSGESCTSPFLLGIRDCKFSFPLPLKKVRHKENSSFLPSFQAM